MTKSMSAGVVVIACLVLPTMVYPFDSHSHSARPFRIRQEHPLPMRLGATHRKTIVASQLTTPSSSTLDIIEETTGVSFTTPPMQVYIEDTDAYGILYNANYLKFYDRALHGATQEHPRGPKDSSSSIESGLRDQLSVSGTSEEWSIVSVEEQKFIAAPQLGDEYVIKGTLQTSTDSFEVWDMEFTSVDGSIVYNRVQGLTITTPNAGHQPDTTPFEASDVPSTTENTSRHAFRLHRDELDAHWESHLPLRNALNFFERTRSQRLGGPHGLRRLQNPQEGDGGCPNGILAVVTSILNVASLDHHSTHDNTSGDVDERLSQALTPGQEVVVDSTFVPKRKGMIIECYQTIRCPTSDDILATAQVNLMMLDAGTRRPTSKLPDWVKDAINI